MAVGGRSEAMMVNYIYSGVRVFRGVSVWRARERDREREERTTRMRLGSLPPNEKGTKKVCLCYDRLGLENN